MKADAKKMLRRMRIIQGQVDGIIRMMEEDRYCVEISTQLMAVASAVKAVNVEVLSAHLTHCVRSAALSESGDSSELDLKIAEVQKVIAGLSKN